MLDPTPGVISAAELNVMKRHTTRGNQPSDRALQVSQRAAKGEARKQRMQRFDREHRQRSDEPTDAERLQQDRDNATLRQARSRLDAEKDDVKHMNSMMEYAKCVTIRDAQILEKQHIQQNRAIEERRLDLMMEVERIKNIKLVQEKERARAAERKHGARVIIQQIQEREAERIRQQELREQEAQNMIERIREAELREEAKAREKQDAGRRLLQEVLTANEAQARAKLRKKQEALEEDMQIAEYVRQKELREQAMEREQERLRAEKEQEISRLRALQERQQDRQAAVDELRAKRYQEQKDRQAREKQLDAAHWKARKTREMTEAREEQARFKQARMADQAMKEREEYYRVLDWQRAQMEADQRKEREKAQKRMEHREALLNQIDEHENAKVEARQKFLEEGQILSAQLQNEHRRLQSLKSEKLTHLRRAGVPEKYRAELSKKKLLVSTIY